MFILCAGPEEELCGECNSNHHQPEEYAGRATLACSQTHHGLPAGEASKKIYLHLTNLWVALRLAVLHLPYLYMPFIVHFGANLLMCVRQVTMQDYRSEVKELFAADEQLAAEVEYNMKQFEKQKQDQEEKQMEKELANFTLSPRQNVSQTCT